MSTNYRKQSPPIATVAATVAAALALWASSSLAAQETTGAAEPPEVSAAALVAQAKKSLGDIGYAVPDIVKLERRSPQQVREDFDALQDDDQILSLFWWFRGMRQARIASAKALRKGIVLGASRGLSAYYHPPRKAFVMLDTPTRAVSEAIAGSLLPLISHELVHAHQDARKDGILGMFRAADTSDRLAAGRCVIEGEAEIIALASIKGIEYLGKLTPGDLDMGSFESSMTGFATARVYAAGRGFSLRRFQQQGVDGLRAAFAQPPGSTEQILHPGKLGKDLPRQVELPDTRRLDGRDEEFEVVCANTIGELQIHSMLVSLARLDPKIAAEAAIGWDGDRIAVLRVKGKSHPTAAIWRSVWDREVDAKQFGQVLDQARSKITYTERHGRCVDLVISPVADLRRALGTRLREAPWSGEVDLADGESTAAAEAQALERLSDSGAAGGFWRIGRAGLKIRIPEGWSIQDARGQKILRAPLAKGSLNPTSINVQVLPNGGITDLGKHLQLNRELFARIPSIELVSLEVVESGDREVIHGEYKGTLPGARIEQHNLVTIYMHGRKQVVVTGVVAASEWKTWSKQLREMFGTLQIADAK